MLVPQTTPSGRLLIQVLFNISTLVVSVAIAFFVSHALVQGTNLLVLLVVAVCLYFLLNSGMISLVLSLVDGKPFHRCGDNAIWLELPLLPGGCGHCGRDRILQIKPLAGSHRF